MSVAGLSIHTVTVQAQSTASDGRGSETVTWADKYAAVAMRIEPMSAAQRALWAGRPVMATHIIYDANTAHAVLESDRILYGTRVFNVLGVQNADEWDRFLRIEAEEIR